MPGVRRDQLVARRRIEQIDIAERPTRRRANRAHREAQRVGRVGRLIGLGGDAFEQFDALLREEGAAQARLGDRLRLEPRGALAFEPAFEPGDGLGGGVGERGAKRLGVQDTHRTANSHAASPRCMHAG